MKVSLVVHTFNQEKFVDKFFTEIPRNLVNEVIVVDGHSTDNTIQKVRKFLNAKDKVIRQKSHGWGAAYLEGFDATSGNLIVSMDADGSHDPADISKLVDKAERGYNFIVASRYAPGGRGYDDLWLRWFVNRMFTALTNTLHGTSVTDSLFFYYAITKEGLNKLNLTSHEVDLGIEILVKAHRSGLKFSEVSTIERPRFRKNYMPNHLLYAMQIFRMIVRRYKS